MSQKKVLLQLILLFINNKGYGRMFLKKLIVNFLSKIRVLYYTKRAKYVCKVMGEDIRVNHKCNFTRNTYIGSNCHFNGMNVNGGGKLTIGDNFHSGEDCLIITQNHNYDNGTKLPYDNTYILKDVTIGKNVLLGSRVIILPGTTIEDGCVVQAGSVVHGTLPRLSVCGGNPCKVIKYRNKEHYEKLETEKMYC